ncbi:Nif3-like dinuclear metal center hexameric protein [Fictibacillus iocasae]|uniref:GTP cyclohydrolase 1 type 2 homolog n=1 Tax=Fictibacillus iocasae TaxID=2715437 RepID=A0ABW2NIQ5_9BACL
MNSNEFNRIINNLFKDELPLFDDDEYGFTYCAQEKWKKLAYATNLSFETIEKAAESNADFLLTHHDAWDFIYGMKEACITRLKKLGISHYYIHSPLDYVKFGTCTSLMHALGVDDRITLSYYNNGGIPGTGEYQVPLELHQLVERMSGVLGEQVRWWKNSTRPVKKIGMMTGAGHSTDYMKIAIEHGCDTYITGEATLYSIQYAEFTGMNLIAGSHTHTEIFGVESLARKIQTEVHELEICKIIESHFELGKQVNTMELS